MYAISCWQLIRKSCSSKVKTIILPLKKWQCNSFSTKFTSYGEKSRVDKDVVLYTLEKPKYFLAINALSGAQCFFWCYIGTFFYSTVKNMNLDIRDKPLWKTIFEVERKYSVGLCALSVFFGLSMFFGTVLYTVRSVRRIILHKGGRNVTIITYNFPGFNNKLQVPLSEVCGVKNREKVKKFVPFKVKNKFFYYLCDLNGIFSNPRLFDFTIGVQRST